MVDSGNTVHELFVTEGTTADEGATAETACFGMGDLALDGEAGEAAAIMSNFDHLSTCPVMGDSLVATLGESFRGCINTCTMGRTGCVD